MDLISQALTQNSTPLLSQALHAIATTTRRGLTTQILDRVLRLAVKRARADCLRFLLDDLDGVGVERVRSGWVGAAVRDLRGGEGEGRGGDGHGERDEEGGDGGEESVVGVLEVLVERGWDVNGRGADSPDPRYPEYLIYQVCTSERLVRWCLDHGAHVSYPDVEEHTPLLDYVVRSSPSSSSSPSPGNSTINIFKLLLDHGAKVGRRTLHLAAASAAAGSGDGKVEGMKEKKMELVRFLVEEVGSDVNGMDVPEGERYGNHFGTPINYVAHGSGGGEGGEVVRYLLEKGANPSIKDCWGLCDAFGYAKLGNQNVLEALNQWKEEQKGEDKKERGEKGE